MMLDDELYADHQLALMLRKTVDEVRAMPYPQWLDWQSFFRRRHAEAQAQAKKGGR